MFGAEIKSGQSPEEKAKEEARLRMGRQNQDAKRLEQERITAIKSAERTAAKVTEETIEAGHKKREAGRSEEQYPDTSPFSKERTS